MGDDTWLADTWAELLHRPADDRRLRSAADVGGRAADRSVPLRDLVDGALRATAARLAATPVDPADTTATLHDRAHALLDTTRRLLAAALDGYAEQTRAELDRHDNERATFVNDLLAGRADPGRLAERAHRYGIRLSATHTVIVARTPDLTPEVVHRIDAALAARFGEGNTLTTRRNGDLVCISAGGLRGISAELAHLLLAEVGADRWQIAVGRTHPGLQGLSTSLDEAHNTLDHAARLGFTAPVLNAADLLVFPVLLRDRDAITDLVSTVLGPLGTARGGVRPYLDTLAVLFDNQGNYTATARQLHLSVRAVTYRLDRIRALTGYHPGEPTQRFTLHTAVLGARLLGWPT
ncbi:helix-turn-helix domain-containing protein [Micromonospora sp. C31]|uniref:PucR family transcriptional regulator n=1 Tax=Micromonospora sp. C31 TaxID=2824876 RepID=UPI001B3745D3|nr:helix-turn-helix domain-containing protein [Micromonospora sp. C31]MBQ1073275.1 helix-turn-helix domain-containing protein [Micromonospora sp. C31]